MAFAILTSLSRICSKVLLPKLTHLSSNGLPKIIAGLFIFSAIWIVLLNCTTLVPPMDNIEQLIWVRSLQWGYYKHPPLPTWLLWAASHVFDSSSLLTYLLGAVFTMSSMAILWQFLAKVRSPSYATIALLASLCITFYNGRLYYYNHNTLLLVINAASAPLVYFATMRRSPTLWIALGMVLGLGILSKYQIAITATSAFFFWIHIGSWRDRQQRVGILLALLTAVIIAAPHLQWAMTQDSGPFKYALAASSKAYSDPLNRLQETISWLADQTLNRALPAWFVLFAASTYYLGRRTAETDNLRTEVLNTGDPARLLLLYWGFVPLVFTATLGILTGAELQAQWSTAFLLFLVPAVMELLHWSKISFSKLQIRRAYFAFVLLQFLLIALQLVTSPFGPTQWRSTHWRNFNAQNIAAQIATQAILRLGYPIQVVIGPQKIAGAIALQLPESPYVLVDGRYDISPWVPTDLARRCGALLIGSSNLDGGATSFGIDYPGLYWRILYPEVGNKSCAKATTAGN